MNAIANYGDKRMTLRAVAEATGASYSTVAAYAQRAGWTQNGKITLLNEAQVTVILEAMKAKETGAGFHKKETGSTFHNVIEGVETAHSRAVRIAVLTQKQREIDQQIQGELQAEIVELRAKNKSLANNLQATENLLTERTTGLSTYQRIAESGGLALTDRDDVLGTYGRRK